MTVCVNTTKLICFLLLLTSQSYGYASSLLGNTAPKKVSITTTSIARLIKDTIDDSPQPFSGSVILLENGKPLLKLQKGKEITQGSSFVIASLSKQITATLILQAVDAGQLDLKGSLNSYLFDEAAPNQPKQHNSIESSSIEKTHFDPKRYNETITIHHLLSHTSGVDKLGQPNKFEPGSQFQYSNFGYSLLGQLLEQVNQQSFAQQIVQFSQDNKLNELYAEVGSIDSIRRQVTSLAVGLNESDVLTASNLVIDEALLPAGGLIASTTAFASFQHKLHSGQFISPKSYELMTQSHTKIKFLWPDMSYGYGLRINKEDGILEYSHTGYLSGYMSMSLHYPEFNLDLVMLENISLNLNDFSRVFELHTQIRQAIRHNLSLNKP
ncbi:serine hydrolase domain-containing protein [Shewanella sp. 10N.286.52.B9]|uniref:serine hydrolase domain-containing protein n=1 Tax=Shewanella sp. 10N.286.52.B9 TaxID=1880837 RepID=UPI000C8344DE|nr:serine hydrolase domain-containing protein [Shewanella sp. 10N.286.52.B9]PMG40957.1 serine hydrolase [Shewanella sp. 10N.286.52.B9]